MTRSAARASTNDDTRPPATSGLPRQMNVERAPRPMSIAVVCPRFPLPMTRADQMTVAHLLAFLSTRGHSVDLYSLTDSASSSGRQRQWVASRCRHVTVFAQPPWRKVTGTLRALLRGLPLQTGWFDNPHLKRSLHRPFRPRHDVIYGYTIRSAEAVRGLGRQANGRTREDDEHRPVTYLAMQVSQSLNTRRIAANAPGWLERLTYRLEHLMTAAYEARIWREFTRTVLIGDADAREILQVCADRSRPAIDNYLLSPHGVDQDRFHPYDDAHTDPCTLVFSGVLAANTNVSAVLWFVEHVWPRVRAEFPLAKFVIVGRMPRPEILALDKRPGIAVTGEVPEPAHYLGRATVCVNPMQAGAGMQNKLLEYLSMGKAVVATSLANEGIRARPGSEILIADGADEFAAAVVSLLRDGNRREALGQAARARVVRDWSWEARFLKLEADMAQQVGLCRHRGATEPGHE